MRAPWCWWEVLQDSKRSEEESDSHASLAAVLSEPHIPIKFFVPVASEQL